MAGMVWKVTIHDCVKNGDQDKLAILLKSNRSPNGYDAFGKVPLHYGAESGNGNIIGLLLSHGSMVNATTRKDECTPLFISAKKGNLKAVQLLLSYGAEVNTANRYGDTPLTAAAGNGHEAIVKSLVILYRANVNEAGRVERLTPLCAAAENGHKKIVELLLYYHANVNEASRVGRLTPLCAAAENGHKEIVELLLSHGADVKTINQDGSTPLHAAAENGHLETVELLLSYGADVTTADNSRCTPLYAAAEKGHKKIVEMLLGQGADGSGRSLLHASGIFGGGHGETALMAAKRNGHQDIVRILRQAKPEQADESIMSTVRAKRSVRVQRSNCRSQTPEILQKSTEVTRQLTETPGRMEICRNCGFQEMKVKSQMCKRESNSNQEDVTARAVATSNPTTRQTDYISFELSPYPQSADLLQQPPTDSSNSWSTVAAPSPGRSESPSKLACAPSSRPKAPRHPQPPSKPVPQASKGVSTSTPQQSFAVPMSIDQITKRLERLREPFKEMVHATLGDCGVSQDQSSVDVGLERWNGSINLSISVQQPFNTTNKYYGNTYHNNVKKADIVQTGGTMGVNKHLPESDDHEQDEDEHLYEKSEQSGGDNNGDVSSDSEVIDKNTKEIFMEDDDMENDT